MSDAHPVIAILAHITDAIYGVWNQPSVVLPAGYVTEVQRAGGIALVLTPDGYLVDHPEPLRATGQQPQNRRRALDRLDVPWH